MMADGVELGDADVEVDGVTLADTTDALAAGVPETEGVALARTTLIELDGEGLTGGVGLAKGGELDADGLGDTTRREGVTEAEGVALTMVLDDEALNINEGVASWARNDVRLADGVALAEIMVVAAD
jgi:hypothetical protein